MDIILLSGKAGTGKDTVADYIVDNYGFVKVSFADPLKRGIMEMFQLSKEQVYDREEREKQLTLFPEWSGRKLLQYVGTELFRNQIDKDIWVKAAANSVLRMNKCSGINKFVFSDVRFPNEEQFTEKYLQTESTLINITRPGYTGSIGIHNHSSEHWEPSNPKFILRNNYEIEDLYKKVDDIMSSLNIK